jgi:hypothetical protein
MTISASTIIQDDMLPVSGLLFRRDLLKPSMRSSIFHAARLQYAYECKMEFD